MIRVLVVDDSAFIRSAFTHMLKSDPQIEVAGVARDGEEALEKVKELNPDVVTLDIEMPRRDGLSALKEIMKTMPRPVLMVSSLTTEGAEATLKALDYGALDFIPKYEQGKSAINLQVMQKELCDKIKAVAHIRHFKRPLPHLSHLSHSHSVEDANHMHTQIHHAEAAAHHSESSAAHVAVSVPSSSITIPAGHLNRDCVAIGVSTGGPPAVQKVLSSLPADFPAYIIVGQHMPASFTGPFARRLDGVSKITVKEAEDGERPHPGFAYVSPGGKHISLEGRSTMPYITISDPDAYPAELYKPSANVLMQSVGKTLGSRALGVMMTGMGSDGCEGTKVLKRNGGRVIAQDESSCVVYGMPRAVIEAGLADDVVELGNMAASIVEALYK